MYGRIRMFGGYHEEAAHCVCCRARTEGTPAFAADMAVKSAPAAPPPAVYNWTGWYVGVNAGASFGNVNTNFNVAPFTTASTVAGTGTFSVTTPGFGFSDREYPDGFIGGGQIGYNWQYSPLIVVGLEADFQGALERDSKYLTNTSSATAAETLNGGPFSTVPVTSTAVTNYTTQIDWFGTVRARIGYVWGNGSVMSYLTGGLAYGEVKINGTNVVSGSQGGVLTSVSQTFGHSQVNTGWVVGYGTEGVIDFWGARNWTWKIESLYMDLGHVDTAGAITSASATNPGFTFTTAGGQLTTHSHFTDGILRAGLNYKFY
jgi:outer membrane immunogenic protein